MSRQPAAHGLDHLGVRGPDRRPDQAGKVLGITLASGKRFKKSPATLTHDVREHRAELDVGGLKRLVDALDVAGLLAGQLLAGTGEVAQRLFRHLNPAHVRPERRALHNESRLDDTIKPVRGAARHAWTASSVTQTVRLPRRRRRRHTHASS